MTSRIKFLISLGNLIKTGGIKRFKEALAFARREFGEIDDAFFNDILNVFRKEGKTKKGEVVPISKNPLEEVIDKKFGKDTYKKSLVRKPEEFDTRKEYERYLDEVLGPPDDVFGSPLKDDLLKEWDKVKIKNVTPKEGIMATDEAQKSKLNLTELETKLDEIGKERAIRIRKQNEEVERRTGKPFKQGPDLEGEVNPITDQMSTQQRQFLGFPNKNVEAIVRTAARDVLEKAGLGPRIKGQDPIDMARQIYGEDFLEALDNISEELLEASSYPEIARILSEKKIYDFKPRQGLDVRQKGEIEDITVFDPGGRKPNADGGLINILKL